MSADIESIDKFTGLQSPITSLSMLLSALSTGDDILIDGSIAQVGESSTAGGGKAWTINGQTPASFFPSTSPSVSPTSPPSTTTVMQPNGPPVQVQNPDTAPGPTSPGLGLSNGTLLLIGAVVLLFLWD